MTKPPWAGLSRAVVFCGPQQPLEIRSYPVPSLQPGELLVRVRCCTLCGSDLHSYSGRRPAPSPGVLGHEITGEVLELPPGGAVLDFDGNELQCGDRVSWSVMAHCGRCSRCCHGMPQKCLSLFKYGHQPLNEAAPFTGGLADVCHLQRGTTICRVPGQLSDDTAALATCAGATTAAALRLAGAVAERSVLIQGAGALGLLASAMARDAGARSVLVVDTVADRLRLAKRFGATATALAASSEFAEAAREQAAGYGIVLEMSGAAEALETGVPALALGGTYVLVGGALPTRLARIPMERIVKNLLTIRGIHNYWPQDLAAALGFLDRTNGTYPFDKLVGAHFELEDTAEAFRIAAVGDFCRVAVVPHGNC